jgi:hypothetical protein
VSLRTGPGAGVVRFDSVEAVEPATLTEDDAARAGVRSLAALLRLLDRREGAHVYRVRVCPASDDPRVALREQVELSDDDRGPSTRGWTGWTPPAPTGRGPARYCV